MLRIDSKRLPLKSSCTDVLNPSLVYGYECVMLLVWCSFCHWLLSLCFQMADIVTEQWIQIQRLEQALHITQVSFFCLKLASGSLFAKFISFADSLIFASFFLVGPLFILWIFHFCYRFWHLIMPSCLLIEKKWKKERFVSSSSCIGTQNQPTKEQKK